MSGWESQLLSYLLSAWLHTLLALGVVAVGESIGWLRDWSLNERAWRIALLAPLLTAAVGLPGGALPTSPPTPAPDHPAVVIERTRTAPVIAAPMAAARPSAPAQPAATAAAPGEPEPATMLSLAPGWISAILLLWAGWASLRLLALGRQWLALKRRCAGLDQVDAGALVGIADGLAQIGGIARPRMRWSPALSSPMVTIGNELLLPTWAQTLPAAQQRALIAHEVAHLRRADPYWRLLLALRDSLLPVPGQGRVARRLGDLAELQCDAWAAQRSDRRALAQCLASCARHGHRVALPALAAAMSETRSGLLNRVTYLIKENDMVHRKLPTSLRLALGAAFIGALTALPSVQLQAVDPASAAAPAAEQSANFSYRSSWDLDTPFGKRFSLSLSRPGYALKVKAKGEFEIAEDERSLSRLDGAFSIEEEDGEQRQSVRFRNRDGKIEADYRRNGSDQAMDAAARDWIGRILATVLREGAVDVEGRVQRIHGADGMDAVLAEINLISSEYARAQYLLTALGSYAMEPAQLNHAITLAERIESDYELRRVLVAAVENHRLSAQDQARLLTAGGSIESDYESRLLLEAAAGTLDLGGPARAAWFAAIAKIDSDYEKRLALVALAERGDLSRADLSALISSMATLDSDYEARSALEQVAERARQQGLTADYARATAAMGSSYERSEALKGLLVDGQLDRESALAVLDAVAGIGSDYETTSVLINLVEHMPGDPDLIARYRQIARGLGDHERGRAERALDRLVL